MSVVLKIISIHKNIASTWFDIYLTIAINNGYTEKYKNNLILSAFLPSYSLFGFVSTHWNEQQTMMLKIRVMKKLSECDLCDLDINSVMRKNINRTENKYWLLTRYIFWRMIVCRISSQRYHFFTRFLDNW